MDDIHSPKNQTWNLPLFLEEIPLPLWPKDVFPEPFGRFISELSRSTETPIELSSLITLGTVATVAQKNYRVQVKVDYYEPVNIWPLIVLPPGARKSRVYSEATEPVREWEEKKGAEVARVIDNAVSQRKTMEVRLKELRSQAAKVSGEKYDQLQQKIENLEKQLPDIPVCPQLWTSDITPEQLGAVMAANGEASAVLSDEGGIFDILSGLYSDGKANIDLFLQAHSGGSVRIDRKSSPPIFMKRALLTMGLTIQPEVIKTLCKNKTFRGRGLLGRFLYVIPKSNIGSRTFEEPPMNPECALQYRAAIKSILGHSSANLEHKEQHVLHLESEAYAKWLEYARCVESLMGEEIGLLSHITDWAGKLPGAIIRIAGLLHIMRYAYQKPSEHEISSEDMGAAIKIGHVLTNHALVVFGLLHDTEGQQEARAIYKWIKSEKLQFFSRRECMRKFRGLKKEDLIPILNMLKDEGILEETEPRGGKGRQSEIFKVNPSIFE